MLENGEFCVVGCRGDVEKCAEFFDIIEDFESAEEEEEAEEMEEE